MFTGNTTQSLKVGAHAFLRCSQKSDITMPHSYSKSAWTSWDCLSCELHQLTQPHELELEFGRGNEEQTLLKLHIWFFECQSLGNARKYRTRTWTYQSQRPEIAKYLDCTVAFSASALVVSVAPVAEKFPLAYLVIMAGMWISVDLSTMVFRTAYPGSAILSFVGFQYLKHFV